MPDKRSRSRRSRRSRGGPLARALARSRLLQTLRKDKAFAILLALGAAGVLALGLGLPRIWRTTPDGFNGPRIHVSLLDLLQARSLKRAAVRASAAGDMESALYAWRGAVANNLGDPDLHRGLLGLLAAAGHGIPEGPAVSQASAQWLAGLTRTNRAELPLIGEALERHERARFALVLLATVPPGEDHACDRIRARCEWTTGNVGAFAQLWSRSADAWRADPVMSLYGDALTAGQPGAPGQPEALGRLRDAAATPGPRGQLGARLLHQVAATLGSTEDLRRALHLLAERRADTVSHHVALWEVLDAQGQRDAAIGLASVYEKIPLDPVEAARLARAWSNLGMRSRAVAFLRNQATAYGTAPEVWRTYFDLLIEDSLWTELDASLARARLIATRQDPLHAEILVAGLTMAARRQRQADKLEFAEALAPLQNLPPATTLRAASALRAAGKPVEALALLKRQDATPTEAAWWTEWFACAHAAADVPGMRQALDELSRIEPDSARMENNKAALLLLTGEDPAEAVRLTLSAYTRAPRSPEVRLNHAIALLRNQRIAEARVLLTGPEPDGVSAVWRANHQLALAELSAAEGDLYAARRTAAAIDRTLLLREQSARLDAILRKVETNAPARAQPADVQGP